MAITHFRVVALGDKGQHGDWNEDHVITDDLLPKNDTTLIIAASNSFDTARADYVCDGLADEVQINEAIADLPAGGGEISLLEGTFQVDAPIVMNKDNVKLVGLGKATRIQTLNNVDIIRLDHTEGCLIDSIWIYGAGVGNAANDGIFSDTSVKCTIENCWVENCGGVGIYLLSCTENMVSKCYVFLNIDAGISSALSDYTIITSCVADGNGGDGIWVQSSTKNVIVGNTSRDNGLSGIKVTLVVRTIIQGNISYSNTRHGIFLLTNCHGNVIQGNVCEENDDGNLATFDGIMLDANCDNNIIVGNRCLENDRDEIRIDDANCEDNIIVANSCKGVDHVAAIVDNGTGTIVANNQV